MTTPHPHEPPPEPRVMHHDHDESYLWDRSGPTDPLVARLETLLAPEGLRNASDLTADPGPARARLAPAARPILLAIAAMVLLAGAVGLWYATIRPPATGWHVEAVAGRPLAAGHALQPGRVIRAGEWLETDASSTASIRVDSIGRVDIAAGSRLRITATRDDTHEVELAHGRIEAIIHAPPKLFFVQTPAARATDMGCRYDLEVDTDGAGLLTVTLGWVLLEGTGDAPWSARVPRGISCAIDPVRGPGTPFRKDSDAEPLLAALDRAGWDTITPDRLDALLGACGRADAVTLWHLLARVPASLRAPVLQRLEAIVTIPATVSRSSITALDPDALERVWAEVQWAN